ncbi:MAG: radical SAM protein [Deltaproteobacteria bacterium]|nr:radical SAM protein [Deltaproteobacteria bacterium]
MSGMAETAGGLHDTWRAKNLRYAWRFRTLIPKMLRNTVRARRGERVLRGVEFAVTYHCNFSCSHCLRDNLIGEREELTADQIIETARAIERLGGIFINYTGGEALLRPDLPEIIERTASIRGLFVSLASNGYILTMDRLRDLRRRGLSMMTMSLDGPTAAIHDGFRKKTGSYDRVLAAVDNAKSLGIDVWLNAVVRSDLAREGHLDDLAKLVKELGCMLTLNLPYAVGGWEGKDVSLTPDAYAAYKKLLRHSWVRWEGSSNWVSEGCPAGIEKLYLTPYGDVLPCGAVHRNYGNVVVHGLEAIYHRMGTEPGFGTCRKGCLAAEEPHRLDELKNTATVPKTARVEFVSMRPRAGAQA